MRAVHITTGKRLAWVDADDLAAMQALVGGLIQRLELRDGCSLYVNEEGKIERLAFNSIGTDLALLNGLIFPTDAVVGDVFVTGPGDGEGGDLDLTEDRKTFRQLKLIAGEAGGEWLKAEPDPADRTA